MTALPDFEELTDLVWALANDRIEQRGAARLQELLADASNRRVYVELVEQFSALEWEKGERAGEDDECGMINDELRARRASADDIPIIHQSSFVIHHSHLLASPTICYGVTATLLAAAAFFAWGWRTGGVPAGVSDHARRAVAADRSDAAAEPAEALVGESLQMFVGEITGASDCQWADPETSVKIAIDDSGLARAWSRGRWANPTNDLQCGRAVVLGRKFALAAGTLEITYNVGTRIRITGPAVYEADAANGGFLWFGRITAQVEKTVQQLSGNAGAYGNLPPAVEIAEKPATGGQQPGTKLLPSAGDRSFTIRTAAAGGPCYLTAQPGALFELSVDETSQVLGRAFRGRVRVGAADGPANTLQVCEDPSVAVLFGKGERGPYIATWSARPSSSLAAAARKAARPQVYVELKRNDAAAKPRGKRG